MVKDIVILGGGASGLLCGIKSAENNPGNKILIIEKQQRIGRKLMSTGNGRCNLTNTNLHKKYYHGSFSKYVDEVFKKCNNQDIISTFENYGLLTKADSEGRVYPYSNHASSVLDVLRLKLEELNVKIQCETVVEKIIKKDNTFVLFTDKGNITCNKLVVSTGSKASPKLGSDISGLKLLEKLGHKVTALSPALCSIPVESKILPQLKGIRAQGKATLYCNNQLVKEENGEIQFTEKALSGICVFNLSSYLLNKGNYEIALNLLPKYDDKMLFNLLKQRQKAFYNNTVDNFLTGIFVKNLGQALLKESKILPLSRKISSITDAEIKNLVSKITSFKFKVVNSLSFDNAQVVAGGILGDEINPYTMESKIVKNLYICGEAIDINGDCGGYNLQFAFASGIIAGENL